MKTADWRTRVLVAIGFRIFQLWARTLRFEVEDQTGLLQEIPPRNFIAAVWHNRLFLFPYTIRRFFPSAQGAGLVSASRDGAVLAEVLKHFGMGAVRGSTSRRGATALLELAERASRGQYTAITPDGPRGPAYEPSGGIVVHAQKSGVEIVPMNFEFSNAWRLKSWDRFFVPKPFSKVRYIIGSRHPVAQTATEDEFERERERLHIAMMALVEMR